MWDIPRQINKGEILPTYNSCPKVKFLPNLNDRSQIVMAKKAVKFGWNTSSIETFSQRNHTNLSGLGCEMC
jgi:hypothetical protein